MRYTKVHTHIKEEENSTFAYFSIQIFRQHRERKISKLKLAVVHLYQSGLTIFFCLAGAVNLLVPFPNF